MSTAIYVSLGVLVIVALVWAAQALGLRRAYRRWLYWRRFKPTQPARGVLSVFQEIVEPEVRYVQEDQRQRHAEIDQRNHRKNKSDSD